MYNMYIFEKLPGVPVCILVPNKLPEYIPAALNVPSGISSQKEHLVTGNSAVKADSKGVEFWKLKEDAALVDATVGREGYTVGGGVAARRARRL
jgi:hypothetical protein